MSEKNVEVKERRNRRILYILLVILALLLLAVICLFRDYSSIFSTALSTDIARIY